MKQRHTVVTYVRLTPALAKAIRAQARKEGEAMSTVIRDILKSWAAGQELPPASVRAEELPPP